MSMLKDKLAAQIPGLRKDLKELGKAHGDKQISTVRVVVIMHIY